jgi:hypothetical protein
MNLSRMAWTRYRTKRDEPGGVRKVLKCKKIYPRLAANGARVATREAREGQKLHILPFFSKSLVLVVVSVVPLANLTALANLARNRPLTPAADQTWPNLGHARNLVTVGDGQRARSIDTTTHCATNVIKQTDVISLHVWRVRVFTQRDIRLEEVFCLTCRDR